MESNDLGRATLTGLEPATTGSTVRFSRAGSVMIVVFSPFPFCPSFFGFFYNEPRKPDCLPCFFCCGLGVVDWVDSRVGVVDAVGYVFEGPRTH